jgi:hypothetical protein
MASTLRHARLPKGHGENITPPEEIDPSSIVLRTRGEPLSTGMRAR